jgi:hypothetical protein
MNDIGKELIGKKLEEKVAERNQFNEDLKTLVSYGLIEMSSGGSKMKLTTLFINSRAEAMTRLSENTVKFKLNTYDGFVRWMTAANNLIILNKINRKLSGDVLNRYLDIIEILDEPIREEANKRLYGGVNNEKA